jgi:hypothetical protein
MRRKVVVGLVGGAVVVTAVVVARRRAASIPPLSGGLPEWAPLRLVEPPARVAPPATRPDPAPADRAEPAPGPDPAPASEPAAPAEPRWVPPDSDGNCPDSHPVKGNRPRRIYHVPGGRYYDSTQATRCFCTPEDAEADGYRAAKR